MGVYLKKADGTVLYPTVKASDIIWDVSTIESSLLGWEDYPDDIACGALVSGVVDSSYYIRRKISFDATQTNAYIIYCSMDAKEMEIDIPMEWDDDSVAVIAFNVDWKGNAVLCTGKTTRTEEEPYINGYVKCITVSVPSNNPYKAFILAFQHPL